MRTAKNAKKLVSLLTGKQSLLILMQDYPDPDAIASAAALQFIAGKLVGVPCTLGFGGRVGRAENRAIARLMEVELEHMGSLDPKGFDAVALVDTQPRTGNNCLPDFMVPQIVIDHHPLRPATREALLFDVRRHYGATSTILYEYLACLGLEPDSRLATGLVYGIQSDTQDLQREACQADIAAFLALYPRANVPALGRIARPPVPLSYYQLLVHALANAQEYGPVIITTLGRVDNPDMIGEVADMLLRREGSNWAFCLGTHSGRLLFSLRTSDLKGNAGRVARSLARGIGTGGGHESLAGGQIPLTEDTEEERVRMEQRVQARFLTTLRLCGVPRRKML